MTPAIEQFNARVKAMRAWSDERLDAFAAQAEKPGLSEAARKVARAIVASERDRRAAEKNA